MVRQQDTKRMAKQWQEKSKVWQGTVKAQSRSSQGAVKVRSMGSKAWQAMKICGNLVTLRFCSKTYVTNLEVSKFILCSITE